MRIYKIGVMGNKGKHILLATAQGISFADAVVTLLKKFPNSAQVKHVSLPDMTYKGSKLINVTHLKFKNGKENL